MNRERFIVFDTETTGLSRQSDRIVEVAAMEFDPATGQTGRYFHTYINPECFIPPKLTQLHGISNALVADKPVFAEVADHFIRFVSGATLIAHNAPFDVGFVNAEFARLAKGELPGYAKEVICTRSMARKALPGRKATLDALCDWYQADRSCRTLHGALVDCQLLAAVYPPLKAQLANPVTPSPAPVKAEPVAPAPKLSGVERVVHGLVDWLMPHAGARR